MKGIFHGPPPVMKVPAGMVDGVLNAVKRQKDRSERTPEQSPWTAEFWKQQGPLEVLTIGTSKVRGASSKDVKTCIRFRNDDRSIDHIPEGLYVLEPLPVWCEGDSQVLDTVYHITGDNYRTAEFLTPVSNFAVDQPWVIRGNAKLGNLHPCDLAWEPIVGEFSTADPPAPINNPADPHDQSSVLDSEANLLAIRMLTQEIHKLTKCDMSHLTPAEDETRSGELKDLLLEH
jgi:hypothetical protein